MTADTIKQAIVALEAMEAASGRIAKEEILGNNRDNEALRTFIKMTLNADVYNIRLKEDIASAPEVVEICTSYNNFIKLAAALNTRKISGNEAKAQVRHFLSTCHPRMRKWYIRVINKDLRIGVAKSLVEACFGAEFLHSEEAAAQGWYYHGCMCAKAFEKAYTAKKPLIYPIAAEPKLDGERAQLFAIPESGKVHVYMRSGKTKPEIEGVKTYTDQVLSFAKKLAETAGLPPDEPLYLDGEFLAADFNSTSSVVSSTKNFSGEDFLKRVRTVLWDWAPLSAYKAGEFTLPWKRRKALLMLAAGCRKPTSNFVQASANLFVAGHVILESSTALDQLYEKSLDCNFEGLMLKQLDAPHVFHRKHAYIVKLKPTDARTGVVIAVLPGDGGNSAVADEHLQAVASTFSKCGTVKDDGYFLSVVTSSAGAAQKLVKQLQDLVHDSVDRRLSVVGAEVFYRYSARMGRLVVEVDGDQVKIGTGFACKAGKDERMDFWQRREELIGMKVDFIEQARKTATATSSHPRFKRLREDL